MEPIKKKLGKTSLVIGQKQVEPMKLESTSCDHGGTNERWAGTGSDTANLIGHTEVSISA